MAFKKDDSRVSAHHEYGTFSEHTKKSGGKKNTESHGKDRFFRNKTDRVHTEKKSFTEKPRSFYKEYEYTPVSSPETNPVVPNDDYILTGRNPIREALKNNRDLEKLLVQRGELSGSALEIVKTAKDRKVLVQVVEKSRLDEISPRHQGLIAFASAFRYSTVDEMLELASERNEDPFLILLDGITDPHNLGAIIRTAECAGAHGVIVPVHRSVGLTPAAVKASAGAVEYLPIARVSNSLRISSNERSP